MTTASVTVEFLPDPQLGGWTALIRDVPAYGEGRTEEEALTDLKEALRAYADAFGAEDLLARVRATAPRTVRIDLASIVL